MSDNYKVEILTDAQAFSVGINPAIYIGPTGLTPELIIGTIEYGEQPSATITGTPERPVLNLVLPRGLQGIQGIQGIQGMQGPQGERGVSVASFVRTDGTGAPGTTDIYTLTLTDGTTVAVPLYHGRDGTGTGDMHTSRYDTDNDGTVDKADHATEAHKASDADKLGGKLPSEYATAAQGNKADAALPATDNAVSATKLQTARTIAISGGATGTATSFNGSANITIPITALDVSKATAGTLPIARGGTGATTAAAARSGIGAQAQVRSLPATLDASGWSASGDSKRPYQKTLALIGVPASSTMVEVEPWPDVASQDVWTDAGIQPYSHQADAIVFRAESIPAASMSIYVDIREVVNA